MRLQRSIATTALAVMTFFALPFSHAADPEIVSSAEAASLGLSIPASTPAGHQIVTIEVTDASGKSVIRNIAFCKSTSGKIYWSNVCPPVIQKTVRPTPSQSATSTASQSVSATPKPQPTETVSATPEAVVKSVKSSPFKSWQKRDLGFAAIALVAANLLNRAARNRKNINLHILALAFEIDFLIFVGDALIGNSIFLWAAAAIFGVPRLRKLLKTNQASTN